uniref:PorV/PorQ family protein n=1 Tax=candidate division WOR-3 bacterium TaxID=2052148 RepID=A0A7V0Z4T1_UNCW3
MHKLLTLLLIVVSIAGAAAQRPGCVFLLIWPGARATAMAGAFSAIADDATACYYNQAGLAFMERQSVTLQHAPWLSGLHEGMYYEYAGYTKPFKNGTGGLNLIYLTTGPTDVVNPDGVYLGTYTTFDIAGALSYGFKLNPNLGIGLGWKFVYSYLVAPWVFGRMPELGIKSGGIGITYAFDTGMLYKPFEYGSLALVLHNIGPNIKYSESGASDPLPYTLRIGLKVQPVSSKIIKVRLTGEITKVLVGMFANSNNTFFENLEYEMQEAWKGAGIEVDYFDFIQLRGGYFYDYEGKRIGFTFGGGIKASGFSLDVGVDEAMYDFKTTNRKFSLSYQF